MTRFSSLLVSDPAIDDDAIMIALSQAWENSGDEVVQLRVAFKNEKGVIYRTASLSHISQMVSLQLAMLKLGFKDELIDETWRSGQLDAMFSKK
jgi:hypothetical protein